MVWGCAANTVKCLVVFFNFLAFISGLAILVAAIVFLVNGKALTDFMTALKDAKIPLDSLNEADIKVAIYLGIAVGAILMLLGFLGCCGALCENQCLLGMFATIMIIMLCIQIGAAIFAFVTKDKFAGDIITKPMKDSFTKASSEQSLCNSWASMQKSLTCCGIQCAEGEQPGKCQVAPTCKPDGWTTPFICTTEQMAKGCDKAMQNFLMSSAKTIGIVILVFALLELAAVIFSCCLCCEIRKGRNLYDYY